MTRRRILILTAAGLVAAPVLWFVAMMTWAMMPMDWVIDHMPSPIRTAYLDNLFKQQPEDCYDRNDCDHQMANAVVDMEADLQRPHPTYRFDYSKLAPLIRSRDGYNDPMPAVGCNVMLLSHDRRTLAALARMDRSDPQAVEACVRGGQDRIRQFAPSALPAVRQALLAEPGLAGYAREEPLR